MPALNGEIAVVTRRRRRWRGPALSTARPAAAEWGVAPQGRINSAYMGQHMTAVAFKDVIKTFYGQSPKFSYMLGCSGGGGQTLDGGRALPGGLRRLLNRRAADVSDRARPRLLAWLGISCQPARGRLDRPRKRRSCPSFTRRSFSIAQRSRASWTTSSSSRPSANSINHGCSARPEPPTPRSA